MALVFQVLRASRVSSDKSGFEISFLRIEKTLVQGSNHKVRGETSSYNFGEYAGHKNVIHLHLKSGTLICLYSVFKMLIVCLP